MPGLSPDKLLKYAAELVPSLVLVLRAVVGEGKVLQQMPFEVMGEPPSNNMFPPETAVV